MGGQGTGCTLGSRVCRKAAQCLAQSGHRAVAGEPLRKRGGKGEREGGEEKGVARCAGVQLEEEEQ